MLEQIKQWIEHRRGGKIGSHDPGNLPNPKTPGEQLLTDCRLIVLDLETTGLNPSKDEVIAIGAVAIRGGGRGSTDSCEASSSSAASSSSGLFASSASSSSSALFLSPGVSRSDLFSFPIDSTCVILEILEILRFRRLCDAGRASSSTFSAERKSRPGALASSRSDSFSASERSELDSDSKLMTGSESDGVAARRRLRAASLPTSDAGEGDREGDGDAMAGSRSPPRSSIVAPAGSSSAGVDAGVAIRGANGGGLRHAC